MITQKNSEHAIHIADAANYNGKRLVPRAGTPLSALVASIKGFNETGTMEEIQALSDQACTTCGTHSEIEEEVAAGSANIISGIVNIARNVINPRCKEVLEAIEKYKERQLEMNVGKVPVVRQIEFHDLFKDEMFNDMIKNYKESNVTYDQDKLETALRLLQDTVTDDECSELIKTGSSRLDEKIADYVGTNYRDATDIAWRAWSTVEELSLKKLLTIFFIINGTVNGRIEKIDGIISDSINAAALESYKAVLGRRIAVVIQRLSDSIGKGDLIVPPGVENFDMNYEVLVIGESYRKWLNEEGGTPEAIMGYAIVERAKGLKAVSSTEASLKAEPGKYVEEFTKFTRHMETLRVTDEMHDTPKIIGEELSMTILKSDAEDLEKEKLQAKVKLAIQKPYYTNTSVVEYVRDVVCEVFTEGDNVRRVLSDIDLILKESGKEDLDYAVYVAIARLIGRWVACQVDVSDNPLAASTEPVAIAETGTY